MDEELKKRLDTTIALLKYNPDEARDYHGRWTAGGETGTGTGFVSSNVREGGGLATARQQVVGARHAALRDYARAIDGYMGLPSNVTSAVGAWADGAEDSLVVTMHGNPSMDAIKAAMAMKGYLADQKMVVAFKTHPGGADSMYHATFPGDVQSVHDTLLSQGVEFHTLVAKTDKSVDVYVFDQGSALTGAMQKVGEHYGNTKIDQYRGSGEFVGSWGTREEGRAEYQRVIAAYTDHRPDIGSQWNRLRDRWGAEPAALQKVIRAAGRMAARLRVLRWW